MSIAHTPETQPIPTYDYLHFRTHRSSVSLALGIFGIVSIALLAAGIYLPYFTASDPHGAFTRTVSWMQGSPLWLLAICAFFAFISFIGFCHLILAGSWLHLSSLVRTAYSCSPFITSIIMICSWAFNLSVSQSVLDTAVSYGLHVSRGAGFLLIPIACLMLAGFGGGALGLTSSQSQAFTQTVMRAHEKENESENTSGN